MIFNSPDFIPTLLHLQTDSSLFVASAANHLLAHILLFFQPVSSTGSNGVHPIEGTRTRDGATDTGPPESSVETSQDYSAVFRTISEFTEESLLHTNTSHTQQELRFLTMVLDQAGPVLRDLLLQSVTEPLRTLVAAGHSHLTHSLMDVIVAAHR